MLGVLSAIKDVATGVGPFTPKKLTFEVEGKSGSKVGAFPFMLNPIDYKLNRKVDWKCTSRAADGGGGSQYYTFSSGNDTLTFTCVMDCSEEPDASLLPGIEGLYDLTYAFTEDDRIPVSDTGKKGKRAQLVKLYWGGFKFSGVVNSLDVSVTLFDPQGRPKRATVTISMQGNAFVSESKTEFFYNEKDGQPKKGRTSAAYEKVLEGGSTADPTSGGVAGALAKFGI